jgi:hypothetical protein
MRQRCHESKIFSESMRGILIVADQLESFGDGTYVGDLPNWNGGRYSIIDGNRIKLDTLTGPGVYEIELSRDRLTFKNDSGCIFQYRRL